MPSFCLKIANKIKINEKLFEKKLEDILFEFLLETIFYLSFSMKSISIPILDF